MTYCEMNKIMAEYQHMKIFCQSNGGSIAAIMITYPTQYRGIQTFPIYEVFYSSQYETCIEAIPLSSNPEIRAIQTGDIMDVESRYKMFNISRIIEAKVILY